MTRKSRWFPLVGLALALTSWPAIAIWTGYLGTVAEPIGDESNLVPNILIAYWFLAIVLSSWISGLVLEASRLLSISILSLNLLYIVALVAMFILNV